MYAVNASDKKGYCQGGFAVLPKTLYSDTNVDLIKTISTQLHHHNNTRNVELYEVCMVLYVKLCKNFATFVLECIVIGYGNWGMPDCTFHRALTLYNITFTANLVIRPKQKWGGGGGGNDFKEIERK